MGELGGLWFIIGLVAGVSLQKWRTDGRLFGRDERPLPPDWSSVVEEASKAANETIRKFAAEERARFEKIRNNDYYERKAK